MTSTYLLASLAKEPGLFPPEPSKNHVPLILTRGVRSQKPGPFTVQSLETGSHVNKVDPRRQRSERWGLAGGGVENGFSGASEPSLPTWSRWVSGWGGDGGGGGLRPRGVSAGSREQASGGSSSNSDRIPPPPRPQARGWALAPRRKTATPQASRISQRLPVHPGLPSAPPQPLNPRPQVRGSLTSRHFSTSPQLRAGENLKVTPSLGRRIRVPRPRSRARLPVRARSPHLAAAHDVGVLRQQIHHLPFAFVAPLRAQHHRHPVPPGPRPGAATVAVGQGGCRRVGLGERHGSSDARRARKKRGRREVSELNCSAAASHMQRKKEPEAGPAPAPAGPPPSSQAPPRSPPQPTQGATMTAPRRPAAAAPPAGRGPGGGNRRHPGPRPRPFRSLARHPGASPASGRGLGRGLQRASPRRPAYSPFSRFSNQGGAEVRARASDYNSRHATLWAEATFFGAMLFAVCRSVSEGVFKLFFNDLSLLKVEIVCAKYKGWHSKIQMGWNGNE